MKKIVFLISGLILFSCNNNEEEIPMVQNQILVKEGKWNAALNHPESLVFDGSKFFYVSDIGVQLAPHVLDGDGKIVKIDLNGNVVDSNISNISLNAPKGSVLINGVLWVNDINKIKGIDVNTGLLVGEVDFSNIGDLTVAGGTGLNDIVVGESNDFVYVSITNNGQIYKVNLVNKSKTLLTTHAFANGLHFNKAENSIYCVSFNQGKSLVKININNGISTELTNSPIAISGFDGIGKIGNKFIISDWGTNPNGSNEVGLLKTYDLSSQAVSDINIMPFFGKTHLNGPADLLIVDNYVIIPAMGEGKIYAFKQF